MYVYVTEIDSKMYLIKELRLHTHFSVNRSYKVDLLFSNLLWYFKAKYSIYKWEKYFFAYLYLMKIYINFLNNEMLMSDLFLWVP